jgi:hypothetical protein
VRDNKKNPRNTHRRTRTRRALGSKVGSARGRQLRGAHKAVGNSGVNQAVNQRNDLQFDLLDEVGARLKKIHAVQNHELLEIKDQRDWYKQVALGKEGYHLPDPTRWHECTKVYMRAAQALANGNLGQGARLVERAAQMEESVYATIPEMVKARMQGDEKEAAATPDACAHVESTMSCGRVALPEELEFGRRILNVTTTLEDSPPFPTKKRWFDGLEEEEEEEEEEDG